MTRPAPSATSSCCARRRPSRASRPRSPNGPRWRAVHLACHGRADAQRPLLSGLILAGGEELTTLDLFRLRIPADLVVLSACRTAVGKQHRAEGIFGLTRAFMLAGSPRVISSLWSVDDRATKALMVKFYELWNPKTGRGLPPLPP